MTSALPLVNSAFFTFSNWISQCFLPPAKKRCALQCTNTFPDFSDSLVQVDYSARVLLKVLLKPRKAKQYIREECHEFHVGFRCKKLQVTCSCRIIGFCQIRHYCEPRLQNCVEKRIWKFCPAYFKDIWQVNINLITFLGQFLHFSGPYSRWVEEWWDACQALKTKFHPLLLCCWQTATLTENDALSTILSAEELVFSCRLMHVAPSAVNSTDRPFLPWRQKRRISGKRQ